MDWFLWKLFWFFLKNFIIFWLDMIEKQGIINLSSYSSKSYISVVLSYSKIAFLLERNDAVFCLFTYCVLFICTIISIMEEVCHQIFLSFILQEVFFWGLQLFCFFFFFFSELCQVYFLSSILVWILVNHE